MIYNVVKLLNTMHGNKSHPLKHPIMLQNGMNQNVHVLLHFVLLIFLYKFYVILYEFIFFVFNLALFVFVFVFVLCWLYMYCSQLQYMVCSSQFFCCSFMNYSGPEQYVFYCSIHHGLLNYNL